MCRLCSLPDSLGACITPCACAEPVHQQCFNRIMSNSFENTLKASTCLVCRTTYKVRYPILRDIVLLLRSLFVFAAYKLAWLLTCGTADWFDCHWLFVLAAWVPLTFAFLKAVVPPTASDKVSWYKSALMAAVVPYVVGIEAHSAALRALQ